MKYVDGLTKVIRLPEKVELGNGEVQYTKNIGTAPDGTLRVMRPKKEKEEIKDNLTEETK